MRSILKCKSANMSHADPVKELAKHLESITTQLNAARAQPSMQMEVLESSVVRVECAYSCNRTGLCE